MSRHCSINLSTVLVTTLPLLCMWFLMKKFTIWELRFKCLEWTFYINRFVDFIVYESQDTNEIDFEIIVMDNQGNNLNSFIINDIMINGLKEIRLI